MAPPMKADGNAPIRNGHNVRQRNRPALKYRNDVKLATRMFSAKAVGRMTAGAIPNRAMSAM